MYVIDLELAALLLNLFCLAHSLMLRRTQYAVRGGIAAWLGNRHAIYLVMVVCAAISAAASQTASLSETVASGSEALCFVANEVYFLAHLSHATWFSLYALDLCGATLGRYRRFYLVYLAPLVLSELIVASNPVTHLLFSVEHGHYIRGPLLPITFVCSMTYVTLGIVYYRRFHHGVSSEAESAFLPLVALSVTGLCVQLAFPMLLVETFCESLSLLGLLLTLENRERHTDTLTGALDRQAFLFANRRYMASGQPYSVLVVRAANLNTLGRLYGITHADEIHRSAGQYLNKITDNHDLYYLGEAGFALLLHGEDSQNSELISSRVSRHFDKPWSEDEVAVQLAVRVSVIEIPRDAETLEQLDMLTRETLPPGLKGEEGPKAIRRRLEIERALDHAIAQRTLEVHYQPIWSVAERRVVSAEALVRLRDPELGLVPPDEFISLAEHDGMIRELGAQVFDNVCSFIRRNNLTKLGLKCLEVNVSMYQLMHPDIAEELAGIMEEHDVPIHAINLEVTEGVSLAEAPHAVETLERMRDLGFRLSLDDYGTGYSNLLRLISSTYTNVKIDKAVLWDADEREPTAQLLDYLIRTIRGLGLHVIQEGVETKRQLDRVTQSGCDLIQGYYFSKPLPEADFLRYVQETNRVASR